MFLASLKDPTTILGFSFSSSSLASSPSFFSSDFSSFLSSLVSLSSCCVLVLASEPKVEALDPPSGSFPDFVEPPASFLERERNEGQQRGIVNDLDKGRAGKNLGQTG